MFLDSYVYTNYLILVHFFVGKKMASAKNIGGMGNQMKSIIIAWVIFISYLSVLNIISYEITKPLQRICLVMKIGNDDKAVLVITKILLV